MIDLFNHKIDIKSNKAPDITKMASNSFRTMQVAKNKVAVTELPEDAAFTVEDVEAIETKVEVEVEKIIPEPAKLPEEVFGQEVQMITDSIDVKDIVKKPVRKSRAKKAEVK